MSKRHARELLTPAIPLPEMLSGKTPNASSIVLCFHIPAPSPEKQSQLLSKTPKLFGIDILFLHMLVLSGMCVDYCFMSIWFMICSCPRSVSPNSFSFFRMDVMFLPSPLTIRHVFCTHTSGGSVATQVLTGALIYLVFFQSNFLLMFHLTYFKDSIYLKAQKTTL